MAALTHIHTHTRRAHHTLVIMGFDAVVVLLMMMMVLLWCDVTTVGVVAREVRGVGPERMCVYVRVFCAFVCLLLQFVMHIWTAIRWCH